MTDVVFAVAIWPAWAALAALLAVAARCALSGFRSADSPPSTSDARAAATAGRQ